MEKVTVKRGRGRPPKTPKRGRGRPPKKDKIGGDVVMISSTSNSPEFENGNNTGKNSSGEDFPNGNIDIVRSVKRRGRPRKHPLDLDSSSSLNKVENADANGLKRLKSERLRDMSPTRRSRGYFQSLSQTHIAVLPDMGDVIRQTSTAEIPEDVKGSPSMNAVVKVFCVHTEPNFLLPWQRKRQFSSNSSGFIIGGRRVLTNAHSVEHHTQVKLKKRGSDTNYKVDKALQHIEERV